MKKKTESALLLTLLLTALSTLAFNVQPVRASGTIYIRPDGTVEGTDKIERDGDIYTFTANIYDEIVVERDNVVVDGAGYTLQGTGVYPSKGILSARSNLTFKNMEIKSFWYGIYLFDSADNDISGNTIANNYEGIYLSFYSNNNVISGNTITNNDVGIWLSFYSNNNVISGNNITSNNFCGICLPFTSKNNVISGNTIANNDVGIILSSSSNNVISGNTIANNYEGIWLSFPSNNNVISGNTIANNTYGFWLDQSSNNNVISGNTIANNYEGIHLYRSFAHTISGNTITNNDVGIFCYSANNNVISGNTIANNDVGIVFFPWSSNNIVYHNNFIDNTQQVYIPTGYANVWDDGYPSGGNYWSDYAALDEKSGPNQDQRGSDGIGDTPYVIDGNNQDNYPLMATPEAINYVIHGLPSSDFDKPEEDVEDVKSDFMEKLADVEETIEERDFERAIEHLQETRNFTYDQILDTTTREEIIAMINSLTAYLENFL